MTRSETAPRIRKGLSRRIWKYRWLYVFLIPALIWYIIFAYGPLYGLQIAFRDFKVLKGITGSEWAGLEHFAKMATDRMFWRAAGNTVYISLIKLVFVSTSGLVLALLLNEIACRRRGGGGGVCLHCGGHSPDPGGAGRRRGDRAHQ